MIGLLGKIAAITCLAASWWATGPATITVRVDQRLGVIDPRIFGHFTEETLGSYEGGISSEMLFNRKFEIAEPRGPGNFNFDGVGAGWEPVTLGTDTSYLLDHRVAYSPTVSQRIISSGGVPAGIQQSGFQSVVPHMGTGQRVPSPFRFHAGKSYHARVTVKSGDVDGSLIIALGKSWQEHTASCASEMKKGQDWTTFRCALTPKSDVVGGKFMVYFQMPGTLWIDSVSLTRADLDDGGFRRDALELTRRIKPPSLRWPGGWFVSDYDWKDGIGPVDRRPARQNRAWLGYTTNDVGVDDFIALCRKLNAEPYICVNLVTSTPEEAAAMVEYVNGPPSSKWGKLRAANGHPEPYRVRAWNIGNEEYLATLGGMRGKLYAERYLEFAKAMRAVDPSIELVAVGLFDLTTDEVNKSPFKKFLRYMGEWNAEMLPVAGQMMTYYSVHHYEPDVALKGMTAAEINLGALIKAEDIEGKLERLRAQMGRYSPGSKQFPIALDEWSVRLPKDPPEGANLKLPPGLKQLTEFGFHGTAVTLRDALSEASVLNLMQRRPKDFAIGNRTLLYTFGLGLIGISPDRVVMSPSALMMEMYSTYDRCEAVRVEVDGPRFDFPSKQGIAGEFLGAKQASYLDVAARINPGTKALELFVVNRHLDHDLEAVIKIPGKGIRTNAAVATLNAAYIVEWNSFAEPDRVKISRQSLQTQDGEAKYRFAAHSISKLDLHFE